MTAVTRGWSERIWQGWQMSKGATNTPLTSNRAFSTSFPPWSGDGWSWTSQPHLTCRARSHGAALRGSTRWDSCMNLIFKGKTHGKEERVLAGNRGGTRDEQLCPCHYAAEGTATSLIHACPLLPEGLLSPWAVGSVAPYASHIFPKSQGEGGFLNSIFTKGRRHSLWPG